MILLPLPLLLILTSHQHRSFVTEFLLLLGQIYHCCLLLLSSMQNLSNLGMKYHQIYVCTSDSQQLSLKGCFLPTTDSTEDFFGVEVPKLSKTDLMSAINATCSFLNLNNTPTIWLARSGLDMSSVLIDIFAYWALQSKTTLIFPGFCGWYTP